MKVKFDDKYIDTIKGEKTIRISTRHIVYIRDVAIGFDELYESVDAINGMVDLSRPAYQRVKGFNEFPLLTPSFTEHAESAKLYLDFAHLKEGDVVIDLGAYSGLTSILFSRAVGKKGRVIAVEADRENLACLRINVDTHKKQSGLNNIEILAGAAWSHNNGIQFSQECNMGSSAVDIVGERGEVENIPSYTLDKITNIFQLKKLDFIKCDIEGAEAEVFRHLTLFRNYSPRIIVEEHNILGVSTAQDVIDNMYNYGYKSVFIDQPGMRFKLIGFE